MPFTKRTQGSWPLWVHLVLLLVFAVVMVGLWMLPVLFTGLPLYAPELSTAKTFLETGMLPTGSGRLAAFLIAQFASFIPWLDFTSWSLIAAVAFAAALFPWWGTVALLFDRRTAWISTVILAMMPVYWLQAMGLTYYSFAFFFLFLSFYLFVSLEKRSMLLACIFSGASFGLCIAIKDAFILFLPWFAAAYLWMHWNKKLVALGHIAIFGFSAFALFSLPILPQVLRSEGTPTEKVLQLLPIERGTPSWDHFYPDQYTYEFDREWYDSKALQELKEGDFLTQLQNEHRIVSFGIGGRSMLRAFRNGAWFTLGSFPDYVSQDFIGGASLWLFILPGIIVLWKRNRRLVILLAGLSLFSILMVRFLLHFERSHLMNDGWILALFAAIGVAAITDALSKEWKHHSSLLLASLITVVLSFQMLQANRSLLAKMYLKNTIPIHLAVTAAVAEIPEDSTVAEPHGVGYLPLVDRKIQIFRPETVERALDQGKLRQAFTQYKVTHVYGYDADLTRRIIRAVPAIKVIQEPTEVSTIEPSPLMEYLLHIFR